MAGPSGTVVEHNLNPYDRETFKQVTAQQALDLLRRTILTSAPSLRTRIEDRGWKEGPRDQGIKRQRAQRILEIDNCKFTIVNFQCSLALSEF